MLNLFSSEFKDLIVQHKFNEKVVINADYSEHLHPYFELLLLKSGNLDFMIEGKRLHLKQNDVLLIPPTMFHFADFISKENYERYVIKFNAPLLAVCVQQCLQKLDMHLHISNDQTLALFEKLDKYQSQFQGETLKTLYLSVVTQIVLELQQSNHVVPTKEVDENCKLAEILSYINNNLQDKITLDSLSKRFYQSKSWIHATFMTSVKMSPMSYVRSKRISLADHLLLQGFKPTQIYEKCGYTDYSSFYRNYTAQKGTPPSIQTF